MNAATKMPVHEHFMPLGTETVDDYTHDWRCLGECPHCGGDWDVAYPMTCLYCDHGRCTGCDAYLRSQAHDKGLIA